jgi:hypothetical protein
MVFSESSLVDNVHISCRVVVVITCTLRTCDYWRKCIKTRTLKSILLQTNWASSWARSLCSCFDGGSSKLLRDRTMRPLRVMDWSRLGIIIGFIDSINDSTTIRGRRSSNVPSSRNCYQTASVDLTSCTTLSSFIHPLTRAYIFWLSDQDSVRTSCHFASFTPDSDLSLTHVSPFPWFHTLWFSESLVVLINYNHTSSSSSAVAEPHSSCCTLTLPLAKLATSC